MSELIGRPRLFKLANRADMIVYAGFLTLCRRADFPLAEVVSGRRNCGHIRNCIASCAMMRLGTRNCTSFRLVNCPTCRIVMSELIGRARLFVLADRADMIVYAGFFACCGRANLPLTELVSGCRNFGHIRNCITSCAMVRLGTDRQAALRCVNCPAGRVIMPELVSRARFFVLADRAYTIVYAGFFACCGRADFPLTELMSCCGNLGHIRNCITSCAMVRLGTDRQASLRLVDCPVGRIIMPELIGRPRLLVPANRAYTIVYAGFLALCGRANFPRTELVPGRGNCSHIRTRTAIRVTDTMMRPLARNRAGLCSVNRPLAGINMRVIRQSDEGNAGCLGIVLCRTACRTVDSQILAAAVKDILADVRDRCGNHNAAQVLRIAERIIADSGKAVRNDDHLHIGVVLKDIACKLANRRATDRAGNSNRRALLRPHADDRTADRRSCVVGHHAVVARCILQRIITGINRHSIPCVTAAAVIDIRQRGTAVKGIRTHCLQRHRQRDLREHFAVAEAVLPDAGQLVSNLHIGQFGAAVEGIFANLGHTVRNGNAAHLHVAVERIFANLGDGHTADGCRNLHIQIGAEICLCDAALVDDKVAIDLAAVIDLCRVQHTAAARDGDAAPIRFTAGVIDILKAGDAVKDGRREGLDRCGQHDRRHVHAVGKRLVLHCGQCVGQCHCHERCTV